MTQRKRGIKTSPVRTKTSTSIEELLNYSIPENAKWYRGKNAIKFVNDIKQHLTLIKRKQIIVIDPASINLGIVLIDMNRKLYVFNSGVSENLPIQTRLQYIHSKFKSLQAYSICCIEELKGSMVHPSLYWSVGAILSALNAELLLQCPIQLWKSIAPADYVKSDAGDALLMAKVLLYFTEGNNADLFLEKQSDRGDQGSTKRLQRLSSTSRRGKARRLGTVDRKRHKNK